MPSLGCMFGLITLVAGFSSDRDDGGRNGTIEVFCMMCEMCVSVNWRDVVVPQDWDLQKASFPERSPRRRASQNPRGQEGTAVWRADDGERGVRRRVRFLRCRAWVLSHVAQRAAGVSLYSGLRFRQSNYKRKRKHKASVCLTLFRWIPRMFRMCPQGSNTEITKQTRQVTSRCRHPRHKGRDQGFRRFHWHVLCLSCNDATCSPQFSNHLQALCPGRGSAS